MGENTRRWVVGLVVAVLPFAASAANGRPPVAADEIGISVSEPKVYEEATLRAMLEVAEARLRALAFIDQAALTPAVGRLSGGRAETTAFSLVASPLPQPAQTVTTEQTAGQSGELVDSSRTIERTESEVAVNPAAPSSTPAALPVSFGLSARDLLAEQMALTYQVMNLRLALDRAASDRLAHRPGRNGVEEAITRKAIVLGFTVSVERPRKNAVAEVELKLDLCDGPADAMGTCTTGGTGPQRASIVMLLPRKDSYNVVNITKNSQSLAGGQITSVFTVGAGFFRGSETYYVARDVDTIATILPPDPQHPDRLRMRWQFRPVLGQKTVEPGPRQVFALLAIDEDKGGDGGGSLELRSTATTRWIRVGRRGVLHQTLAESSPTTLPTIGYWGLFNNTAPVPFDARWIALSPTRALITIEGALFSSDARLLLGERVIDRTNGLEQSEENRLAAVVPLNEFARAGDVYLTSRFLDPSPIRYRRDPAVEDPPRLEARCRLKELSGAEAAVHVEVRREEVWFDHGEQAVQAPDLVVIAKDQVFLPSTSLPPNGGATFRRLAAASVQDPTSELFEARIPVELLRGGARLRVRELLAGEDRDTICALESASQLENLVFVEKASVLSRGRENVVLAFTGDLPDDMEVLVNGRWMEVPTEQWRAGLAYLTLPWNEAQGVERLLVRSRKATSIPPQIVAIDRLQAPRPRFQFEKLTLAQGSTGPASLKGLQLDSIVAVSWDGAPIEVRKSSAEELTFIVPARLTETAGVKRLELELVDGQSEWYPVEVVAPKKE